MMQRDKSLPPGAQWLKSWAEEYWDVLNTLAVKLQFTGLEKSRKLTGMGGAETHLAQPTGTSLPNPIVVKLGPEATLQGDIEGSMLASTRFRRANYPIEV